jgi:hypothetical protein
MHIQIIYIHAYTDHLRRQAAEAALAHRLRPVLQAQAQAQAALHQAPAVPRE